MVSESLAQLGRTRIHIIRIELIVNVLDSIPSPKPPTMFRWLFHKCFWNSNSLIFGMESSHSTSDHHLRDIWIEDYRLNLLMIGLQKMSLQTWYRATIWWATARLSVRAVVTGAWSLVSSLIGSCIWYASKYSTHCPSWQALSSRTRLWFLKRRESSHCQSASHTRAFKNDSLTDLVSQIKHLTEYMLFATFVQKKSTLNIRVSHHTFAYSRYTSA